MSLFNDELKIKPFYSENTQNSSHIFCPIPRKPLVIKNNFIKGILDLPTDSEESLTRSSTKSPYPLRAKTFPPLKDFVFTQYLIAN